MIGLFKRFLEFFFTDEMREGDEISWPPVQECQFPRDLETGVRMSDEAIRHEDNMARMRGIL